MLGKREQLWQRNTYNSYLLESLELLALLANSLNLAISVRSPAVGFDNEQKNIVNDVERSCRCLQIYLRCTTSRICGMSTHTHKSGDPGLTTERSKVKYTTDARRARRNRSKQASAEIQEKLKTGVYSRKARQQNMQAIDRRATSSTAAVASSPPPLGESSRPSASAAPRQCSDSVATRVRFGALSPDKHQDARTGIATLYQ